MAELKPKQIADPLEMLREEVSMPDGRKLYRYTFIEDGLVLEPPKVSEPGK